MWCSWSIVAGLVCGLGLRLCACRGLGCCEWFCGSSQAFLASALLAGLLVRVVHGVVAAWAGLWADEGRGRDIVFVQVFIVVLFGSGSLVVARVAMLGVVIPFAISIARMNIALRLVVLWARSTRASLLILASLGGISHGRDAGR